ncbi:hypothetical protein C7H83_12990 [Tetragenococcus halophilus]|uniref:Uncharacterized protein n=2 Tax=Tetragenococcus TaxID=51668 RepID=A0AA37XM06_9ENTE|nr:hypothetical protein C7K38_06390 [Tetragenococcus osmophilus]AYW51314.1 hypothetical protein C7H83_12990 [Tetragenococcus halophilus]GMA53754.1 hypothetical protein GCM10025857_51110 [Alicyclobacillus contaminans]GEQ37083.1 hypothetical protein TH3N_02090 [Tetragenococcus halophilus]GEQ39310.1 hypothetical protein TH5N_01880 [Tetragenococcus halophilus]
MHKKDLYQKLLNIKFQKLLVKVLLTTTFHIVNNAGDIKSRNDDIIARATPLMYLSLCFVRRKVN